MMLKQDGKLKGHEPKWSTKVHKIVFAKEGGFLIDDEKRRVYHRHELLKVAA